MISNPCIEIQTSSEHRPSVPAWFAEVVIMAYHLQTKGLLDTFEQQVRLVRGRFGRYEPIDFLALLIGYAISGERTWIDFFERVDCRREIRARVRVRDGAPGLILYVGELASGIGEGQASSQPVRDRRRTAGALSNREHIAIRVANADELSHCIERVDQSAHRAHELISGSGRGELIADIEG